MATFALSVVTPEREVLRCDADMILVRGAGGDLGILARHIPLVTPIVPSVLEVRRAEGDERFAVTGGFLEVRGTQVSVLARTAERPEEIDVRRAQEARERAKSRLDTRTADLDLERAQLALLRANARIAAAGGDSGIV